MNWKTAIAMLIIVLTGWPETTQGRDVGSTRGRLCTAEGGLVPLSETAAKQVLANEAYRLVVRCTKDEVVVGLDDRQMGLCLAQGAYLYRVERRGGEPSTACCGLRGASADVVGRRLTIRGKLAGLDVEHSFDLPADRPIMEERIVIHNRTGARVELSNLEMGFVRAIADKDGKVLPELARDRFVAIPFRAKPDDAKPHYNDFSTADLIHQKGYEVRIEVEQRYERVPADRRQSEGWAWTHGPHTLGIFKFDQENMQWSVLATDKDSRGATLRFGGACDDRRRTVRPGPDRARTNGAIGSDALSDRLRRIRERDVCLPRTAGRKRLPFSQGLQSARPLGAALRHGWRLERPAAQVHQGHRGERGGQGRGLQLRGVVSRSRLGQRFRHVPLGRKMARAAESVCRADAVEIRPESLAAHAAGLLDVDRLADGWKHGAFDLSARRAPQGAADARRRNASRFRPATTAGEIWLFCRAPRPTPRRFSPTARCRSIRLPI